MSAGPGATALVYAVLLSLTVFELFRRRRLGASQTLPWLLFAAAAALLAFQPGMRRGVAAVTGAKGEIEALLLLLIFFLTAIGVRQATEIAELKKRVKILAQKLALFEGPGKDPRDPEK